MSGDGDGVVDWRIANSQRQSQEGTQNSRNRESDREVLGCK